MATKVTQHALERMKERGEVKNTGQLIHLFETGKPLSRKQCRKLHIENKPNITVKKNGNHIIIGNKYRRDISIITYFQFTKPSYRHPNQNKPNRR